MAQSIIDFYGKFKPTGVDTSEAERYGALARAAESAGNLAATIGLMQKKQDQERNREARERREFAEAEAGKLVGAELGAKAAAEGTPLELRTGETGTLAFDRTFNNAARMSYLSGIENAGRARMIQLEQVFAKDPEGFNNATGAYIEGALESVDPAFKELVGLKLQEMAAGYSAGVSVAFQKNARIEQSETITASLTSASNEAARLVRAGQSTAAQTHIASALNNIDAMKEAGFYTEDQAQQEKRKLSVVLQGEGLKAEVFSVLDQQGWKAAYQLVDERKDKVPPDFTIQEWEQALTGLYVDINRYKSINSAEQTARTKMLADTVGQYTSAMKLGFAVSPEEHQRIYSLAKGTEYEAEVMRLGQIAQYALQPAGVREDMLIKMRGQASTVQDIDMLADLEAQHDKLVTMADKDGISLGQKQGLIDPVELNLADPNSLVDRTQQAAMLSEHYGTDVGPLTDLEATTLGEQIKVMTPQEKVAMAKTLSGAPSVWGQIASKNQGAFALVGASGDEGLMRAVFTGQEMIANNIAYVPSAQDYMQVVQDYVGQVYGPNDLAAVISAAKAHYAATTENAGVFDADEFEMSLQAVTGGIAEINGNKIELPRGVREDQFEDFLDGLSSTVISLAGGVSGYTDEEAVELIQDSAIVSVGNNEYAVMPNASMYLMRPDGEMFTFSYTPEVAAQVRAAKHAKRLSPGAAIKELTERGGL